MSILKKTLYLFLALGLFLSAITIYSIWQYNLPLINPLSFIENYVATPRQKNHVVYGFFPYWNIKYAEQLHIKDLTHFAYFAADLNEDGSVNKKINSKETEPGWNKLNSNEFEKIIYQVRILGQRTVITITAMDTDLIDSILNIEKNRQNAINSIIAIFTQKNFDGINIDFEYVGYPDQSTRNKFTSFINDIKHKCLLSNPKCQLDIDVFGDTGRKPRLQDLEPLSKIVDHVIVMAYDYYRKSSTQAGPVAPLRGMCTESNNPLKCLEQDITTNISEITKIVPPQKILLGIPFYGYEWQTASDEFLANTYPKTGSLATYQRIISLFSNSKVSSISAKWSSETLSPYLSYIEDGDLFQVHFENAQSISMKINLVKSANLGGIAIWALGYEVPHTDIWEPISKYLHTP